MFTVEYSGSGISKWPQMPPSQLKEIYIPVSDECCSSAKEPEREELGFDTLEKMF